MTTIKSMADLEKVLNKKILSSVKSVGNDGVNNLKESVQNNVYNVYIPKYYKRTGDLKKSASKEVLQKGSLTSLRIYHNTGKMRQMAPTSNYRMGTHHSSVENYSPQEYAYFVPTVVEDGTSGKIFGEGAFTRPRRYFSIFATKFKVNFSEKLRTELIRNGLTIRRG
jgi:hypothetical protein